LGDSAGLRCARETSRVAQITEDLEPLGMHNADSLLIPAMIPRQNRFHPFVVTR
jgi:hypothetical protein